MGAAGLEIERKFLIKLPPEALLEACRDCSVISQTYLEKGPGGESVRVRKRAWPDRTVYTHTVKKRISAVSREETEREISESEYLECLRSADRTRRTIEKKRYCLEYMGQLLEIDVFPFWPDTAFLEIELESEDQGLFFPPELEIIRELTDDRRFTNSAIARSIPPLC